jgi:hypothetical protein
MQWFCYDSSVRQTSSVAREARKSSTTVDERDLFFAELADVGTRKIRSVVGAQEIAAQK